MQHLLNYFKNMLMLALLPIMYAHTFLSASTLYSILSLRGDVKIFYIIIVYYVALYVLRFSLGFLAYHS
jgi:hypothetical protein